MFPPLDFQANLLLIVSHTILDLLSLFLQDHKRELCSSSSAYLTRFMQLVRSSSCCCCCCFFCSTSVILLILIITVRHFISLSFVFSVCCYSKKIKAQISLLCWFVSSLFLLLVVLSHIHSSLLFSLSHIYTQLTTLTKWIPILSLPLFSSHTHTHASPFAGELTYELLVSVLCIFFLSFSFLSLTHSLSHFLCSFFFFL